MRDGCDCGLPIFPLPVQYGCFREFKTCYLSQETPLTKRSKALLPALMFRQDNLNIRHPWTSCSFQF